MEGDDPADLLFWVHDPFFSTGYLFFGSRALRRVVWHLCRPIPRVLIHAKVARENREKRALEWC
jgi:hypothetical protein